MAKRRVVTATKLQRFSTFYGTTGSTERQSHAEEREAKRWLQTRLDKAYEHTLKYGTDESATIAGIRAEVRDRKLMMMKPDTTSQWEYTYSGIHVICGVTRIA